MQNKARKFLFDYYWLVPIFIFFALIISLSVGWYSAANQSLWLAIAAMGLGWTYFFQKQKLEEHKFYLASFDKFNKRFYELSDELKIAVELEQSQTCDVMKPVIHKYFDLCLEEFQLYKAKRIPEKTWEYWASGMHHYLKYPNVAQYWRKMETEKLDDGLTIAHLEKLIGKPIGCKNS